MGSRRLSREAPAEVSALVNAKSAVLLAVRLAASLLCLHPATHPIADLCSLSSIVAPELPRTATGKTEPRITRITRINKTFVLGSDRRYPHCYRWKSSCSAKIFLSILASHSQAADYWLWKFDQLRRRRRHPVCSSVQFALSA